MQTIYTKITDIKGNLITVEAEGACLGELAEIEQMDGRSSYASVLRFDSKKVTLQVFGGTSGLSTGDRVTFLGRPMEVVFGDSLLGRRLNGIGKPIDGEGESFGDPIQIATPTFNPVRRVVPRDMVRTNIPMIDVFNCLVKSQKIPIFSSSGEKHNALLMRIAAQTDADIVIIGGMGLTFVDYNFFVEESKRLGFASKCVMFIHKAVDAPVECMLIPDMALACAEKFAVNHNKNVLVLLTDMTAFADALKEISITMDQIPANRGYPGSLYSDLALRYEKAVDIANGGSITIISVTTMPGDDITHPIPDNTGFITEGQFYLKNNRIDPFGSLSRLKQLVIGKVTREDHGDLANALIRLYADSRKASERMSMGFKLSNWDKKLLEFSKLFETRLMSLEVNIPLEEALDIGWKILAQSFHSEEVGIKEQLINKYWPKSCLHR
ncbi:V-type ATP synthase subunit B [Chlamydia gallinacea]|uniref:V-type ATP synthase beta chain n=2 Tax=Chlamydia gallinacea TaxID=1457153 RepID=A0A173DXZ0_9CHLA|nr:V-type ATP synthase subunit B [Chlamydia gallinacea]EYE60913.1 ATP synthase alpha/beta family, nucleotide-binding domain protein [Bacteroides fragilis str. S6L5]ANG65768.1 V-type ATP synthase subunit B [Chlamydia gallinacea 08-1274/3]AQT77170.1 V-type ATP synthase subunit B [Chlamydia gallinacea]MBX6680325.1 V-type ATP synthase subunit B [Chlamydia gallinacea]MBX6687553.1 V-type ATP synthase subunit B [Chlamydia gallinacea]